jgi:site-specific DNA-methyltransferase (adenine-specific)
MEAMKEMEDNQFDLAIVDPPYGIGMKNYVVEKQQIRKKKRKISTNKQIRKKNKIKQWDESIPNKKYFDQIQRVSKNQIIWGGNYFTGYLKPTKSWIFWYKGQQGLTMSDGELAWTSFNKVTRMVEFHRCNIWNENPIHPTQKPVKLYEWLLMNYANEGDKILVTISYYMKT